MAVAVLIVVGVIAVLGLLIGLLLMSSVDQFSTADDGDQDRARREPANAMDLLADGFEYGAGKGPGSGPDTRRRTSCHDIRRGLIRTPAVLGSVATTERHVADHERSYCRGRGRGTPSARAARCGQ